jgi:hypothetical protein
MRRRSALVLAAFLCAAPSAFADAGESPKISEKACHLPHLVGRIETVIDPEVCADGRCGRDFDVILLRPDDSIVYDVKGTFRRGDPPLPSLDCRGGLLVLAWRGQTLRLELDAQHALRFVASDRRRLDALWSLPVARTHQALATHESLRALLELAGGGLFDFDALVLEGIEDLTLLVELVVIRDHLQAGELALARERMASLESRRKKGTPLSPELAAHLAELQQELAAAPE